MQNVHWIDSIYKIRPIFIFSRIIYVSSLSEIHEIFLIYEKLLECLEIFFFNLQYGKIIIQNFHHRIKKNLRNKFNEQS